MGTPASGTITLDEVHVEAGGSSGSQASFNDFRTLFRTMFSPK